MPDWHAWALGALIAIPVVYVLSLLQAIHTIITSKAAILEIEARERKAAEVRDRLEGKRAR